MGISIPFFGKKIIFRINNDNYNEATQQKRTVFFLNQPQIKRSSYLELKVWVPSKELTSSNNENLAKKIKSSVIHLKQYNIYLLIDKII